MIKTLLSCLLVALLSLFSAAPALAQLPEPKPQLIQARNLCAPVLLFVGVKDHIGRVRAFFVLSRQATTGEVPRNRIGHRREG